MDAQSENLALRAAELGLLAEVSGARVREEIYDLLAEKSPSVVLTRLAELGALGEIVPARVDFADAIAAVREAEEGLARVRELSVRRVPSRKTALLAALGGSGAPTSAERWVRHFRIGREEAETIRAVASSQSLQRALANGRKMRDSRLFAMLSPLRVEALANLWARGDATSRERIERYIGTLASVRPAVSGQDLIAMGAEPGEAFSAILARARDDRLDGRAVGREAELANLKRLAVQAGLIAHRKDS